MWCGVVWCGDSLPYSFYAGSPTEPGAQSFVTKLAVQGSPCLCMFSPIPPCTGVIGRYALAQHHGCWDLNTDPPAYATSTPALLAISPALVNSHSLSLCLNISKKKITCYLFFMTTYFTQLLMSKSIMLFLLDISLFIMSRQGSSH